MIITRAGIDKIQAMEKIQIEYKPVIAQTNFSVVHAFAYKGEARIETFGSALKGETSRDGNCNTWYVMEMAEKELCPGRFLSLQAFMNLVFLVKTNQKILDVNLNLIL